MKVISSLAGLAAIQISNDDVGPERGVLQRDMVDFIGNLYSFNIRPTLPPGAIPIPILQFQSGEYVSGKSKIPVSQILIAPDGDAVQAQNTDLANEVLTDYLRHMDAGLGFRYATASFMRLYQSLLVVEFQKGFVECSAFNLISDIVNSAIGDSPDGKLFSLKRLGLGQTADNELIRPPSISGFVPREFVIERRASEAFSRNRFFCSAPLTTDQHIKVLAEIEQALV